MQRRWWFYFAGLILGTIVLITMQLPSPRAVMIACDVGQGDAMLIIKGSNQVLIDGGPSGEKILSCLGSHMPFWDRHIELMVLTNTDYDHMQGLGTVIERYAVSSFVTSDGVHSTEALERFRQVLVRRGVTVTGVEQGQHITVGGRQSLRFEVLWPPKLIDEYLAVFSNQIEHTKREQILGASAKRGDLNERSVVLLLTENGYQVLLTGDIGFQAENELLSHGHLRNIDVLKVGHHGSKYASGAEFLRLIDPEIAIISAGAKNRYGHPTAEVLNRLSTVGAVIQRTDVEGDIILDLGRVGHSITH